MNRRNLLKTGFALAGGSLLASNANAQKPEQETAKQSTLANTAPGRRKLGTLEVSSIGLGVQNMHRTYQTTIPSRTEMVNIIRTAFDHGVTFFDTAEVYGPFVNEELVGEALQPFKGQVVIATKFGFKQSPMDTSRWSELDSRPEHIKEVA